MNHRMFLNTLLAITTVLLPSIASEKYVNVQAGLTQVPLEIPANTTNIAIGENNITNFDHMPSLSFVTFLNASHNRLAEFPYLGAGQIASTLQYLYLEENGMTAIKAERLDALVNLVELSLKNNLIEHIPDVAGPASTLQILFIEFNSFKDSFPVLRKLGSLKLNRIQAYSNRFVNIPDDALAALPHLQVFDNGRGYVDVFPTNLHKYNPELMRFQFHLNNVKHIPQEVFQNQKMSFLLLGGGDLQTIGNPCLSRPVGAPTLTVSIFDSSIICDCRWVGALQAHRSGVIILSWPDGATCSSPPELAGRQLVQLLESELSCRDIPHIFFTRQNQPSACNYDNITELVTMSTVGECAVLCMHRMGCSMFGYQAHSDGSGTCALSMSNTPGTQDWHLYDVYMVT